MEIIYPIRINKYLAQKNYSTRTGADELIKKGLVLINGQKAELGAKVYEEDEVVVRFRKTEKENKYVYYAYNKKIGISTNPEKSVIKGKAQVADILKVTKLPTKVFPIGRLDQDSHGLIIMTNDGRVTDRLLSPKYVHEKEYIVKIDGTVTDKFIENMSNGVSFDGKKSLPCKVWRINIKTKTGSRYKNTTDNYHTFGIILTEGKKRQIRRMCEALYQKVTDLKRIRVMNVEIGNIKDGEYREIKGEELNTFLKLLGLE